MLREACTLCGGEKPFCHQYIRKTLQVRVLIDGKDAWETHTFITICPAQIPEHEPGYFQ